MQQVENLLYNKTENLPTIHYPRFRTPLSKGNIFKTKMNEPIVNPNDTYSYILNQAEYDDTSNSKVLQEKFDNDNEGRRLLLSANLFLTGGYKYPEEHTLWYLKYGWYTSRVETQTINPWAADNLFKPVLRRYFPEDRINTVMKKLDAYYRNAYINTKFPETTVLHQIFIKKDIIDDIAICSLPYGYPLSNIKVSEIYKLIQENKILEIIHTLKREYNRLIEIQSTLSVEQREKSKKNFLDIWDKYKIIDIDTTIKYMKKYQLDKGEFHALQIRLHPVVLKIWQTKDNIIIKNHFKNPNHVCCKRLEGLDKLIDELLRE